jgi:hypothetical protein
MIAVPGVEAQLYGMTFTSLGAVVATEKNRVLSGDFGNLDVAPDNDDSSKEGIGEVAQEMPYNGCIAKGE